MESLQFGVIWCDVVWWCGVKLAQFPLFVFSGNVYVCGVCTFTSLSFSQTVGTRQNAFGSSLGAFLRQRNSLVCTSHVHRYRLPSSLSFLTSLNLNNRTTRQKPRVVSLTKSLCSRFRRHYDSYYLLASVFFFVHLTGALFSYPIITNTAK